MNKSFSPYLAAQERMSRLEGIRSTFAKKEPLSAKNLDIELRIYADYSIATDDNLETSLELGLQIPPEVTELHFKACLASGISECICYSLQGATMPESEIL